MKTFNKFLIILAILFIVLLVVLFFRIKTRDKPLLYTSKWTKAICNETHCIDMIITCNETDVISIVPTSDLICMGENWRDPRPIEVINRWC